MFVAQHAGWQLIQDEDGELHVKYPQDINQLIELQEDENGWHAVISKPVLIDDAEIWSTFRQELDDAVEAAELFSQKASDLNK